MVNALTEVSLTELRKWHIRCLGIVQCCLVRLL